MKTVTRRFLLLATLLAALVAAACGSGSGSPGDSQDAAPGDAPAGVAEPGTPTQGGTLRLALYNDPPDLDVQLAGQRNKHIPAQLIHDVLVRRHPETGELVPGLLARWDVTDDGLVWTLELKPGMTFPSGRPVTAEDLKAVWERALDPEFVTSYARNRLGPVSEMVVKDELTLEVHFSEPFAPFLDALTDYALSPIDMETVAQYGDEYPRHPAGLGPYRFVSWTAGSSIRLERNPDYRWAPEFYENRGAPYPDAVEFSIIPEYGTRRNAFLAGELDILEIENVADIEMLQQDPRFEVISVTTDRVASLDLNTAKAPTDDVLVRRALNYAVDREPLAAMYGPGARPSCGPLSPASFGYWKGIEAEGVCYRYDPEKAAELLDSAGWTLGADGWRSKNGQRLKVVLGTIQSDIFMRQAQLVQAQLQEIGVEVEIVTLEAGAYAAWRIEGNHNLAFNHEIGLDPDPRYTSFHSSVAGVGRNFAHYRNPRMDELLETQRRVVDLEERAAIWEEIQKLFIEDAIWLPIHTVPTHLAYNRERGAGFHASPYGEFYHDVWLKQ
ncbi:MAG TPA: ABC transporter substrate-binding protein [Bacillota bacterium]